MYFVVDPYDAFRFDRAVFQFGSALSAELDKQEGKNSKEIERKRTRIYEKWIPESRSDDKPAGGFREPGKVV